MDAAKSTTISVIIPAYNEAARIGATLAAVRALFAEESGNGFSPAQIVVVDDGSGDDTAQVAERAGADCVLRQVNGGKGAALRAGFALANGDILLLLDADLGETAREAAKLLHPVLTGAADMTIATFPTLSEATSEAKAVMGGGQTARKGGGLGLVVRLARWGIGRLTGQTMAAPLSGQRALRREVIETVGGFADGWGVEVALTVRALRAGFRVWEVSTQMAHRVTGRSPAAIAHRGAQFVAAARVLWRLWREGTGRSVLPPSAPSPDAGSRP